MSDYLKRNNRAQSLGQEQEASMTKAKIREKIRLGNLNMQTKTEMLGRRIGQIMKEQGLTIEELAKRVPDIPRDYLSQLVEGQALFGIRSEWKRELATALGLKATRVTKSGYKSPESLSDELDSLFMPEPPNEQPPDQLKLDL